MRPHLCQSCGAAAQRVCAGGQPPRLAAGHKADHVCRGQPQLLAQHRAGALQQPDRVGCQQLGLAPGQGRDVGGQEALLLQLQAVLREVAGAGRHQADGAGLVRQQRRRGALRGGHLGRAAALPVAAQRQQGGQLIQPVFEAAGGGGWREAGQAPHRRVRRQASSLQLAEQPGRAVLRRPAEQHWAALQQPARLLWAEAYGRAAQVLHDGGHVPHHAALPVSAQLLHAREQRGGRGRALKAQRAQQPSRLCLALRRVGRLLLLLRLAVTAGCRAAGCTGWRAATAAAVGRAGAAAGAAPCVHC